ncbi:class I SAM-dependent methyltransferase [Flocculibacter collagenilyticus]|uniref:class I SAM-dependent methyltransferase n=1 Tax=Flocculibacter collagenilyticus TaxID=2744479 RepID=UPI0018F5E055|nr:class I SAM-dependent methyltransferase [Flocculibacter collagenilyticus]
MSNLHNKHCDQSSSAWSDQSTIAYVKQWGELPLHNKVPEFCNLQPSEVVLDIGCGSGAAVRAIANKLVTGHVTGIDPTPKMLEIATSHSMSNSEAQRMTFLLASAEQIPAESESCDLVLAVNTIHHWANVSEGMKEVYRILKPSGRFVAIDDLWEESPEYTQSPVEDSEASHQMDKLKTRHGIVELLKNNGFLNISDVDYRTTDVTASIITGYKES